MPWQLCQGLFCTGSDKKFVNEKINIYFQENFENSIVL